MNGERSLSVFTWVPTKPRFLSDCRRWFASVSLLLLVGCKDEGKVSEERAVAHVAFLAPLTVGDVEEVRSGLPQGVQYVEGLWKEGDAAKDPEAARLALLRARQKTQDLRVAKSTFFAIAAKDGFVIRTDQDVDMMANANILAAFPELAQALTRGYVETLGSMHEARGVEGKPDGQWVAAQRVMRGSDPVGLYVTGWAWSLYARRLEEALKSQLHDEEKRKMPLFYTYVVVGQQAYGTRVSPQVNAESIQKLDPLANADEAGVFRGQLEITGRTFGFAAMKAPALGETVMVGVLRSET